MAIQPIHTEAEYLNVLHAVEELWDAAEEMSESDRLEVLVLLTQDYETRHHPITDPITDPDPSTFLNTGWKPGKCPTRT